MIYSIDLTLAVFVSSMVSAGAGAFLGSYLRKKGENLATHEDIKMVVDQVRAVTTATKEIEAKISNEVWDRQRQWEMKREAISSVVQTLLDTNDALASLSRALRLQQEDKHPERFSKMVDQRATKCGALVEAFNAKRVLALLVCHRDLDHALTEMHGTVRQAIGRLGDGDTDEYETLVPTIRKQFARAMFLARRELGMEWKSPTLQPNESSRAID